MSGNIEALHQHDGIAGIAGDIAGIVAGVVWWRLLLLLPLFRFVAG
jgi:hypothetical protein